MDQEEYEQQSDQIELKYLTFCISDQHYALPISNVIEIVQMQQATPLPKSPNYARGVINLRGQIVPLLDLNLRMGQAEQHYTDRTCIIIVDIKGEQVGFIVDSVDEVLDIQDNKITPTPQFPGENNASFITGIGRLSEHMVLLIDCTLVYQSEDTELLH